MLKIVDAICDECQLKIKQIFAILNESIDCLPVKIQKKTNVRIYCLVKEKGEKNKANKTCSKIRNKTLADGYITAIEKINNQKHIRTHWNK